METDINSGGIGNIGKEFSGQIAEFVEACHQVARYKLQLCSSGNLSCRLDEELAVISASRSWLMDLTDREVAICRIADGTCINGKKASVETEFHMGILQQRRDIEVVLHFQSPYATAVACGSPNRYNFFIIPEIPFYIGEIGVVDYLPPGSSQLAQATIATMQNYNLAILRNHGLVTVGKNYQDAIQRAVFFELACRILILQKEPAHLSPTAVEALKNDADHI